ncbi:MAG TPA: hypothetical protein VMG82_09165 [Candidatus Sulfotelmatobacter sp.]|nr:hypothetical protein [Candidatus Sulfotelmatobacter sp.]
MIIQEGSRSARTDRKPPAAGTLAFALLDVAGRTKAFVRTQAYNFAMRAVIVGLALLLLTGYSRLPKNAAEGKAVTVPATIDHNRVLIRAEVRLPNGSTETVRAWVDNGNPDLYLSRRVAVLLALDVKCRDQECLAPPPSEILIGGMSIPLTALKEARVPLRPPDQAAVLALGMNAEINIPSSILRHYDVLVDFVGRKFSIGAPGTIHFQGSSAKVQVNAENGLVQVPSQIEGKKYNLALDFGSCISFLSEDLFAKLAAAHPDWPHMTGAVGSANMWGAPEETEWKVMRVDRVQYGSLFLTNVPMVSLPRPILEFFEKRVGMSTLGLMGSNMLLNYRVGLDYVHSTVYFDLGRTYKFPDFDVVGLVLRPEGDGRISILGVADFDGKPSVEGVQPGDHLVAVNDLTVLNSTMGQVWFILGGKPGDEKRLTIERAGKEFTVSATVRHFLAEVPDDTSKKKR